MFADAGLKPPTTWEELVADAKKLTQPSKGVYGMAMEGGSYTEGVHFAYIFGKQHGSDPFTADGKADFTSPGQVAGVKQYVDLMGARTRWSTPAPRSTRTAPRRPVTSPRARPRC